MSYAERINNFNESLNDSVDRAKEIAGQAAQLKALNKDPTRSVFDKVNDSVSTSAGIVGTTAQIYNTYKHGKLTTFLQKFELNKLTGQGGNPGIQNAGKEAKGLIDLPKNVSSGVAPNSGSVALPQGTQSLDSLKGKIIGNQSQDAKPTDLGEAVARKAVPDSEVSNDAFDPASAAPAAVRPAPASIAPSATGDAADAAENSSVGIARGFIDKGRISNVDPLENVTNEAQNVAKTAGNVLSDVKGAAGAAADAAGDAASAGENVASGAASIAKAAASAAGEASGDTIAGAVSTGLEALAPEVGPAAPVVAAIGGLIQLGTTIAGLVHKKPKQATVAPPPPPQASQIGVNLSEIKI
jgi:hypothetical protein